MLSLTVQDGEPPPDLDPRVGQHRRSLSIRSSCSSCSMKAAQGGHA
jgi:hypothetical protein